MIKSLVVLSFAFVGGCNGEPTGGGGLPALPAIALAPADGTTNPAAQDITYGASIRYVLDTQEGATDPQTVGSLLSLCTWPELDVVGTGTPQVTTSSSTTTTTLSLVPTAPLSERWYAIRLASVPTGMRVSPSPRTLSDGSMGSLFYAGSTPILLGMRFYAPKNGDMAFELIFSEPVSLPTGDGTNAVSITQAGAALQCQIGYTPGNGTSSDAALSETNWAGTCTAADPTSTMTLTVSPGFTTTSGQSIATPQFAGDLTASTFTSCGDDCWFDDIFATRGPPK